MFWLRAVFILACALLYYAYYSYYSYTYTDAPFPTYIAPLIGLAGGLCVMLLDLFYRERIARNFFAVFIGLLIGVFFSDQVIVFLERFLLLYSDQVSSDFKEGLKRSVIIPLVPVIYLIICYTSVILILRAKESLKLIIPFVSLTDESRSSGGLVLDSSVLIDGRILDLCRSKLIDSRIVIPRFIISELQMIADSSNKIKRLRGRRGLDIVKKLQSLPEVDVEISDDFFQDPGPTDERLVKLASRKRAKVVTNDFNLLKVAQIQGVEVVNINDIARAMRLNVMVGENIEVEIVREGEGADQGVGYLPDGTMVVVEGARSLVGSRVTARVTNIYARDAGRIVFAKVVNE